MPPPCVRPEPRRRSARLRTPGRVAQALEDSISTRRTGKVAMPSLIEQATAIRESARAAGDADAADQTLKRAVGIATELGAAQRSRTLPRRAQPWLPPTFRGPAQPRARPASWPQEEEKNLQQAWAISSSAQPRVYLTRASEQLADTAEKAVSDAWEKWTQEQLQGVGTAAQVLERALSRGPFAATIEKARAERERLQVLSQRFLRLRGVALAEQRAVLKRPTQRSSKR